MTHGKRLEDLEICHVFGDSIVLLLFFFVFYCSFIADGGAEGGYGVYKLVIFFGRYKCMTLR